MLSLDAGAAARGIEAMLAASDHRGSLRAPLQALAKRLAIRL